MTKMVKIFSVLLILFSIILSGYSVLASDIDMNLVDNSAVPVGNEIPSETDTDTTQDPIGGQLSASNVNAIEEEGLSTSNIISILLITVGVILILLAIAIIIRLK